jgi:tRNA G37 N-methylase TrmD
VQKADIKELNRQAKRTLLVDNWAKKSPSLSEDQLAKPVDLASAEVAEAILKGKNESIKEWRVAGEDYSTDESQDGCGCW